ncbi:MAG: peptidase [Methylophaga sp.]|nr:peptidase [Methylophaga sp.]
MLYLKLFVSLLLSLLFISWASIALMLNHAERLGLDDLAMTGKRLMQHYQIAEFEIDRAYLLGRKVIAQIDHVIYADTQAVISEVRPLVGGVMMDEVMVLATDDSLILLTAEGDFLARLGAADRVPPEIQNIGLAYGEPVLQTRSGMWRSNFLLDDWEKIDLAGVSWSQTYAMPDSVYEEYRLYFLGQGISLRQLLSDLQRGKLTVWLGVWFADLLWFLMTVLALLSLWRWSLNRP